MTSEIAKTVSESLAPPNTPLDMDRHHSAAVSYFRKTLAEFIATKEKALITVENLFNDVLTHPSFDTWCRGLNAERLKNIDQIGYNEVVCLISVLRMCFSQLVRGMNSAQVRETLTYFKNKGFDLQDLYQTPPVAGLALNMHYIQLNLSDGAGTLFIYNSDSTIGR